MDAIFTPVRDAAYAGDFALFETLLARDPDLITQNSTDPGDSPNLIQFIVVEGGLGKIPEPEGFLKHLIDNGSTTYRQLVAAASVNSRALVDTLLDAGVSLDEGAPWSAVEETLYWGHQEMAVYLISERGAKLNTLCAAAMLGNMEKLASFFNNGKLIASVLPVYFPWGSFEDSTEKDAIEQAFFLALRNSQYEVASYLLERGVDINAIVRCHHEECTALHQAANSNDFEMADWLIDRGAVGSIKDKRFNADAIDWAKHEGNTQMEQHMKRKLLN